jgi:hypothetical protein
MSNFQEQANHLTRRVCSLERLWELARFTPNEEQQQAIEHVKGP